MRSFVRITVQSDCEGFARRGNQTETPAPGFSITDLLRHFPKRRKLVLAGSAVVLLIFSAACAQPDSDATPTLQATRTITATATPNNEARTKARVSALFAQQVALIQQEDWAAVYQTCSPSFRSARTQTRYVQDASAQFRRDGYVASGFEARNVEPFVRAPDRIRVRWDAYQDGRYVRTNEIGQTYIFTQGDWFDDGAWCR